MEKVVRIKINELIYDVENKTYLTGRSRSDGKNHVAVANMQLNDDAENRNQVIRSISTALTELTVLMSGYLKRGYKSEDNALDEKLAEGDVIYEFNFPGNMDKISHMGIANVMHDYVVARGIADWFKITNKSDAAEYEKSGREISEKLIELLSRRQRPERPQEEVKGDD